MVIEAIQVRLGMLGLIVFLDFKEANLTFFIILRKSPKAVYPLIPSVVKTGLSANSIKIYILGYFCMQNSDLHWKYRKKHVFLRKISK